ncbi:MAG: Gfo/Idh/MocA family oxidoreductase [Nitrospirae bacterium]|nr:Gfo/Idh/MocA family oxidoreductase [Nitrospirota bacterium]MCL5237571.1 Gfo/Idh/MocA family oxidoreductase [Nitrospirota bacterium]
MNIAIVGCGLIGEKRAKALGKHRLIVAADTSIERAQYISSMGAQATATTDWKEAAGHPDVELVIVATTNNWLTPVSLFAIEQGKHVLVEKPAARSPEEIEPLVIKAHSSGKKVKVGFNLRFHPAMMKAKEIIDSGVLGELMFIRGRYGHGGRIGYDREWRADPVIAGGGELLDQGVHLIDLSRWILGDFDAIEGFVNTYFWDMPVEDNGFISMRTKKGQMAWLHASCSEWKNMFCLEIYGKDGKLQIDGLGGSYGTERLTYYKMLPHLGPPETTMWEYPFPDNSWKREFDYFVQAIADGHEIEGNLYDAKAVLVVVSKIYGGSK